MYDDCARATRSLYIEQYIIQDDAVGQWFLELFTDKARSGVRVRMILDAVGSRSVQASQAIRDIREAGGKVVFYRPLWWVQILFPSSWFPRNHCKVMVIDEKLAYVGGVCMAEYMAHWRDRQLRITEPLVADIAAQFACSWSRLRKGDDDLTVCMRPPQDEPLQYTVQQPRLGRNPIYCTLVAQLDAASHYAYFATPYFFPPQRLRTALLRACRRGVDVIIMISQKTDVPFADDSTRNFLPALLKAGLKVIFYQGTVMHAKYAIIDDKWATVGSTNFDHLSLAYNREANIVIRDRKLVTELKQHFMDDCNHCIPANMQDYRRQTFRQRCVGMIGGTLHKLM